MIEFSALIERFHDHLAHAIDAGAVEPTAFALATAGMDGAPSVRMLLLKHADTRGFVFYSNRESRKGTELRDRPRAAMCFWWGVVARQIRIEGIVEPVTDGEADAYFASRPRGSQVGAWASAQSRPLASRADLLERAAAVEAEYRGRAIPRPPHWSGWRLAPDRIEFWYGQENRLHERIEYRREAGGWVERILAP